jgi:predicted Zn-dependent protease
MMDKLVIRDMITTLIAVDVTGNDSDTVISSTWLLPETLKPTSFGHGATDDESSWKRTEKVMSKKDVTRLNQVAQMAEAVVYAFFRDVNTQLFAPNNWERKFGKIELSSVSIKGAAKTDYFARRKPEQVSFVPQTELERQYGNWISENVLRHMVVVRAPEFEQYVESVAMSILANAGVSGMRVRIRILSNAMVNAFSLSNGDIYLTAGLLDTLETIDELAIVLGHELGHMVHGDIHHSLEKRKSVRIARHAMMLAGTVAGGLAAAGIGTGGATIVTQSSSQTMTLSALKAVSTALGTVALCETTGWVSEEIYSIIFEGFSKESELQADAFAIRYVSAVGYAPKAAKSTLAKLSVAEEQLRAELDSSGVTTKIETSEKFIPALMGAKPGLQKRMEQIDKLLVEFQQKEKDLE